MKQTSFPGYFITPDGRVWSERMDGRWLRPKVSSTGYLDVHLRKDGFGHMVSVHRLVADAFVPNSDGLPWVNHIDGNKLNNAADNLEWVTPRGNSIHATATGLVRQRTAKKSASSRLAAQRMSAAKRTRTTCGRGHEYTPENTRIEAGTRRCRACRQASNRKTQGEIE